MQLVKIKNIPDLLLCMRVTTESARSSAMFEWFRLSGGEQNKDSI